MFLRYLQKLLNTLKSYSMRKPLLAISLIYLSAFLFFKEEVHSFAHHIKEVNHKHSLACFFGGKKKEKGLVENCLIHDLFIAQHSLLDLTFFAMPSPKLLTFNFFVTKEVRVSQNSLFLLPPSRAPPIIS